MRYLLLITLGGLLGAADVPTFTDKDIPASRTHETTVDPADEVAACIRDYEQAAAKVQADIAALEAKERDLITERFARLAKLLPRFAIKKLPAPVMPPDPRLSDIQHERDIKDWNSFVARYEEAVRIKTDQSRLAEMFFLSPGPDGSGGKIPSGFDLYTKVRAP